MPKTALEAVSKPRPLSGVGFEKPCGSLCHPFSKKILKRAVKVSIFAFFVFASFNLAQAQVTSSGIAIPLPVSEDVEDGDLICTRQGGNFKCSQEFDPAMVGVYSENPSAEIEDEDLVGARSVITSGVAKVRVSSIGGNIAEGDFVTSSSLPGIAQAAVRNGYVLGTALEEYQSDDPQSIGKIAIVVNIHPNASIAGPRTNLINIIREASSIPVFEPLESLRYLLAILIVLIAFTLGLIYFGRASRAGIEAIGRNPLAKRTIQFSILMHVTLSIVIILAGLAIAYLVLIL